MAQCGVHDLLLLMLSSRLLPMMPLMLRRCYQGVGYEVLRWVARLLLGTEVRWQAAPWLRAGGRLHSAAWLLLGSEVH